MAITASATPSTITLNTANSFTASCHLKGNGITPNLGFITFSLSYTKNGVVHEVWTQGKIKANSTGVASVNYSFTASTWKTYFNDVGSDSLTVTFKVDTGVDTATTNITLSIAATPLIEEFTTYEPNQLSSFVEEVSTQTFQATISGQQGATIQSVTFTKYDGTAISANLVNGVWVKNYSLPTGSAGNYTSTCTATDSRGEVSTATVSYSIKPHNAPTVSFDIYRCDSNGDFDASGGYLSVTGYANANPADVLTIQSFTLGIVDSDSTTIVSGQSLTSGTRIIVGGGNIDPDKSYTATFTAIDDADDYNIGSSLTTTQTTTVPVVTRIMNVHDGGDGVAFGKMAESDKFMSKWAVYSDSAFFSCANNENKARGMAISYDNGANVDAQIYVGRNSITYNGATTWFPRRWMLNVYSRNATTGAKLGFSEIYRLPEADYGLGANQTYDIVTTKYLTSETLSSGSWSSKTQTITVTGVTSSNTVIVCAAPASMSAYQAAGVYCSAQGTNSLTFTCTTTPTSNLTVNIMVVG